jgi:hypothetical protein
MTERKLCPSCSKRSGFQVWLPVTRFGRNAGMKDGLQSECRECRSIAQRHRRARILSESKNILEIPPRADRVFRGKPGEPLKVVHIRGGGW